jgi:hypothetical protein
MHADQDRIEALDPDEQSQMNADPESDLQKIRPGETGAAAPRMPTLPEAQVCQSTDRI